MALAGGAGYDSELSLHSRRCISSHLSCLAQGTNDSNGEPSDFFQDTNSRGGCFNSFALRFRYICFVMGPRDQSHVPTSTVHRNIDFWVIDGSQTGNHFVLLHNCTYSMKSAR
jgi:hypothetical protein